MVQEEHIECGDLGAGEESDHLYWMLLVSLERRRMRIDPRF